MIFVDSNVPMYLVGSPHPNRDRAIQALDRMREQGEQFTTGIEVYQEILHRYVSIRRFEAVEHALQALQGITGCVLPYGLDEIRMARDIILSAPDVSARDALHVAVMHSTGITRIFSYDAGFDSVPGIDRLE